MDGANVVMADREVGKMWISVKERHPKDGELVITIDKYARVNQEHYQKHGYYPCWHNGIAPVLYWMPVPKNLPGVLPEQFGGLHPEDYECDKYIRYTGIFD